mmetsp:Transcript_32539/g.77219  ORF Transcript_32539/g.77219 Transcript_32539/m.77219 type:complete len:185 (-) Transcript_32539:52-606(-)
MMPTRWSVAALALASLPCVVGMGDMKVGVKNFHAGMMEQPDFDSITLFHVPTFTGEMTPYSRLERAALKAAEAAAFKHDSNRAYRHEMKALFSQEKKHAGSWLVEEPEIFPNLELEPIGYSRQWIGEEKLGGCWSSDTDPLSDQKKRMIGKLRQTPDEKDAEDARSHDVTTDADGMVHIMPKKR